jgi:phage tail sheath gpL-like
MSYYINKNQARTIARADLTIFNETQALMKQVIQDADAGLYQTTVSDGTTMTESTPTITLTGTVANPTITATPTLIIAGSTITLGTTGTNLNSVIADINDAAVSGVVASKNSSNNLVITYTAPASTTWSVTVGAGTANTDLGLTAATTTATNPDSVTYYNVWQGSATDRVKTDQMNQVILYFQNLGYTIERLKNTSTNKNLKWVISY